MAVTLQLASAPEVLRLIELVLTSDGSGEELNVSRGTIDARRTRIHQKLGLGRHRELVRFAIARDLTDGPEEPAR